MSANYSEIQELLQQRADFQARLNLVPYDGNPEKDVPEFKKLLVAYYEGEAIEIIAGFMKKNRWKNF